MGKNKQVLCKICYKTMRSDHLRGHMKIHEENGGSKRKYDEMEEDGEALKKYLIEKTNEYKAKITLGKEVYLILGEGEVLEQALPEEMKDALDIYIKQAPEVNQSNVELKP